MSSGVSAAALFSWLDLQFEVLPFPSPEPKRGGCVCCVWLGLHSKKARQGCVLQERLRLLNQALTMELRGRGRGDGCSEAGSLGAGMVGAREGQKRGRKKGERRSSLRMEGRMKM